MSSVFERSVTTFAANATLSSVMNLDQKSVLGVAMDTSWTAASISFQVGFDGVKFLDAADSSGTEYVVAGPSADKFIFIPPTDMPSVAYLRLRSGTAAVPVAQDSTRTMSVLSGLV